MTSKINFSNLQGITGGEIVKQGTDQAIIYLLTDSRKQVANAGTLFFAIDGKNHDGHDFIEELYQRGCKNFIVERPFSGQGMPDANIIKVRSTVEALQQIATFHRKSQNARVVAITGSNGKTIIKEWLYQLLTPTGKVVKSPHSYNSQIGVPLSVWNIENHHELAIIEAGVSIKGEMDQLEKITDPEIGIFSNIGTAHSEGFANENQKIEEKTRLFIRCKKVIYCKDHKAIDRVLQKNGINTLSWGESREADIVIGEKMVQEGGTKIVLEGKATFHLYMPFTDAASIENAMHCVCLLIYLGFNQESVNQGLSQLQTVSMRLELKKGINNCTIIDDTYNNDLAGLATAIEHLVAQSQTQKSIILSDLLQTGLAGRELYSRINNLLTAHHVQYIIGIGPAIYTHQESISVPGEFFRSTEDFLEQFNFSRFNGEAVLVKGARPFCFERIVQKLEQRSHRTVLETSLKNVLHNLNYYRALLPAGVRTMAMLKAMAYGSGSHELGSLLDHHGVNYLGVAYVDEGVSLRKHGVKTPIMVMNPDQGSFRVLLEYNLEPEIYSLNQLQALINVLEKEPIHVHLKLETGMNRLGLYDEDLSQLISLLQNHPNIIVASLFSHLVASNDPAHDEFTHLQARRFSDMAQHIEDALAIKPLRHLLNTAGISRFPQYQFDMVRMGIGLHGLTRVEDDQKHLLPAQTLKTYISQLKKLKKGDTVGYGREGKALADTTVATVAIGYADGYNRAFSRGVGKMLVGGKQAPVIGNVCMDMSMLDVTGLGAREGDEVVVFGPGMPVNVLANTLNTIPYEVLSGISERVNRVYYMI
ncbi:MAG: bifunctional UDP-N-acetylmuramoyl-tripeptide:D-alanyl-D-alanine ligase/alanine racemase [Cyclobacteriaceae bacterium]|nr:bifunctional UDP-N-acetylmuramoyl-tripeptide:D-alanyl-D-alanine ligase/alanine racemase [Cyclobacteriaceae bacterium]